MRKSYKKFLSLALSFVLTLAVCGTNFPAVTAKAQSTDTTITIFHTNDMHGRLLDATKVDSNKNTVLTQIGADYVAAMKESVPGSLLIDAGDATQGLPFSTVSKGADVINLMNAAGYDGMVLGNHEFDYGKTQLLSNAALAKFPVVSANTMDGGKPLLAGINGNNGEDFIKTVNGIKVGFFGITTQETVYKTNPSNLPGVTFSDPISTSQAEVTKLKGEGAEVIVGIMHIGNDPSSDPISEKIASSVNGINVIIDGHSHTVENKTVNNTLIAQTGCNSANVGRIDITVSGSGSISSTETLISAAAATTAYTPDATVAALAKKISDSQAPIFAKVLGYTNTTLWGGTVNGQSVGRLTETNLGDLVADSMVYGAKSQLAGTKYASVPIVALENGGGVRDSIPAGYITQGQVTTVLPFGNILSLKEVTPAILYQVIENGVSKISGQDSSTGIITGADGRFPQISGMRFEYDPTKPASSRVTKIVLLNADGTDKQVLSSSDTTTQIVLASNDYEVGGGDGYSMLGSLKNIGEGNALDVICGQYITKITQDNGGKFSYPISQGRCKVVSSYSYKPYTASITVTNGVDGSGKPIPAADCALIYSVDNGQVVQAKTDANGVLTLANVATGSHTVSISYNNLFADAFINDSLGAGTVTKVSAAVAAMDDTMITAVTNVINSIPSTVTLADKNAVAAARKAYDGLTQIQKTLVTNYDKLTKAEAALAALTAASNQQTKLPVTGSMANTAVLMDLSAVLMLAGAALLVYKKKETD